MNRRDFLIMALSTVLLTRLAMWAYVEHEKQIKERDTITAALDAKEPCGGKYKAGYVFWNKDRTGGLRLIRDLDGVRRSASFVAFGNVEQPQFNGLVTPSQKESIECITTCSCQ